mgnify:CR=1 FL=1
MLAYSKTLEQSSTILWNRAIERKTAVAAPGNRHVTLTARSASDQGSYGRRASRKHLTKL